MSIALAICLIDGVLVIGVTSLALDSIADGKFLYIFGGMKPGLPWHELPYNLAKGGTDYE